MQAGPAPSSLRISQETEEALPDFGYCAAHKAYYFGYKLQAVCIYVFWLHPTRGLQNFRPFKGFCARHTLPQLATAPLCPGRHKGYLNRQYQHNLFDAAAASACKRFMRHYQLGYQLFNPILCKTRKRIKTLLSQLCDQFMNPAQLRQVFPGLATRNLSKLTTLTLIQWLNRRNGTHLNNLKTGIA